MKNIFIDMDGVLAEYRDGCTPEDMAKKGYFASLRPEWNMLGALHMLIENADALGVRICVLTKVYPHLFTHSVNEKHQWKNQYMPELFDSEFVMVNGEAEEKSDIVRAMLGGELNSDCILIDDYNQNLNEWMQNGGTPVKYVNSINDKNRSFIGSRLSFEMSAQEIYGGILNLIGANRPAPAAA